MTQDAATKPGMAAELQAVVDSYLSPATSIANASEARAEMATAAAYLLWRSFGGDAGAAFGSIGPFMQRVGMALNDLYAAGEKRG